MKKVQDVLTLAQIRLIDGLATALGANHSYERFFAFEYKYGFPYTRLKARSKLGYKINLKEPRSLNEKSIHRRLFSRDPIWPVITHKVGVRKWLKETHLDRELGVTPLLHIVDDVDTFAWHRIDEPVIIKAAWGSGLNVIVKDPRNENWSAIRNRLRQWQSMPYYPKRLVWAETQMERQFVVERLFANSPGGLLDDYKFYVIHGRVEMLQVVKGRDATITFGLYDRNLAPLAATRTGKKNSGGPLHSKVADMIPAAERIGQYLDFARIDLYLLHDRPLFGEITPCPVNGHAAFTPTRVDFELGEKWAYDHNRVYNTFLNIATPTVTPVS